MIKVDFSACFLVVWKRFCTFAAKQFTCIYDYEEESSLVVDCHPMLLPCHDLCVVLQG
jgi:hypothetical protein